MYLQPGMSMGDQNSRSSVDDSANTTTKLPKRGHPRRTSTESQLIETEPPAGHNRPINPPAGRDIVRQQLKWATAYVDLTRDSDGRPPLKTRRIGQQHDDTTNGTVKDAGSCRTTTQLKNEPPGGNNLVGYASSSSGSPRNEEKNEIQANKVNSKISCDQMKKDDEKESSTKHAPRSQIHSKMPFVDEGYGSFTTSQENTQTTSPLTEAELAKQLINSDKLRSSVDKPDTTYSNDASSRTSGLQTQNAMAWKERIEREGVEKSRALRQATKQRNSHIFEVESSQEALKISSEQPKHSRHEEGILDMFGPNEDGENGSHVDRQLGDSSASNNTSSGWKPALSKDSTEEDIRHGEDDDGDDLFCNSQESLIIIETSPSPGREHIQLQTAKNHPKSSQAATTCSRYNDALDHQKGQECESQTHSSRLGRPDPASKEDLEAGARRLKAFTRFNERQKAGPKTLFTSRHELDTINRSYQEKPPTNLSPPANQKFYSPFGEVVRRPADNQPRAGEQSKHQVRGPAPSTSKPATLSAAPNRHGGLTTLAQKAGQDNGASSSKPPSTIGRPNAKSNPMYRSTTISADEFQVDFSKYKRQLSQEERDIITRHEWLRERLRDLKMIKSTYLEAAKVSCITGVTERMEEELPKVDELREIVLEQGKHDRGKRDRVQKIKYNMVSRQTRDVPSDRVEFSLGMLIDGKSLLRIDEELNNVQEEMEDVGCQRLEKSNRRKPTQKEKKKVRFACPVPNSGGSRPPSHISNSAVVDLNGTSKAPRPKFGTEEYRQSQSKAYWESQALKEAALREQLRKFDEPAAGLSLDDAIGEQIPGHAAKIGEDDEQSEVSEEDAGGEMYAGIESASIRPVSRPASNGKEISLAEMNRLDAERKQQEQMARPHVSQPEHMDGSVSAQAPDPALAAQMRRAQLGIPEQEVENPSATASDTSETEDDDASVQMVNNYIVYGLYQGVPELEDYAMYRLGRFLKRDNAEALIGEKVVEFCDARKRDMAEATAAEDEAWLARLGDPDAGTLRHDIKTKAQVVQFPASSCHIWLEKEEVEAKSRAEKRACAPRNNYEALYQRTMADGSVQTPSWEEVVSCTSAAKANQEAVRVMGDWYAEHMKDGYLAMQRDALVRHAEALGEEGCFAEEESFQVPGGKETMRVWVGVKRMRGACN